MKSNNPLMKVKRLITHLQPIDKKRYGKCKRCGACCKFMFTCPFLAYDSKGKAICKVYKKRGYICIKYPVSEKHHETKDICGFKFMK